MTLSTTNDFSLAITQIRPVLRDRRLWAALLGIGFVLGLAGPFGTLDLLPLPLRLIYWVVMVAATGPVGFIVCHAIAGMLRQRGMAQIPAAALAGAVNAIPINVIVHGLNAMLLAPEDIPLPPLELTLANLGISIAVSVAVSLAFFSDRRVAGQTAMLHPPYSAPPRLLERLPKPLRAELVSLEATDHYTVVVTTKGQATILLRLSDAIVEAAPTAGLRLHRSHWVALDQITASRRDGPRAVVTLTDGRSLPVSRSNVAALEEAGFLPPR
jgi:hypothetical protein